MSKRCITLFLAIGLLLGLLAGCAPAPATTPPSTAPATTPATTPDSKYEMSDVPNMTAPGVFPIVVEPVTLTIAMPQYVFVTDYKDNFMTKRVKEETGIDLEFQFLPSDLAEAAQKWDLMVTAGQKLPDIFYHSDISMQAQSSYGKSGVFKPLNDYFDKYTYYYDQAQLTDPERELIRAFGTSPDGNIYGFPTYAASPYDEHSERWYINREWMSKLGLKDPTTTDELYDVLKAFKERDPNGNNKPDEIPMIGVDHFDGQVYYTLINSFIHYNYLYLLSFSLTRDEYKTMMSIPDDQPSVYGIWGGHATLHMDATCNKLFEYDTMGLVKGPQGVSWMPHRAPQYNYSVRITKDCATPEIAFRLFDYMTETKNSLITRYGEPGVHWMYRPDDTAKFDAAFPYSGKYAPIQAVIPGVAQPWSSENNSIWGDFFCSILPAPVYIGIGRATPFYETYEEARSQENATTGDHGFYLAVHALELYDKKWPTEEVTRLIYNDEENKRIGELKTTIHNYIKESMGLFVTDQLSIEKDWDTYLKELESMGLSEYLKISQDAYDRMYK